MTIQLHGLKTTGLVPIGGVVATIPALAGAYACSATTAADDLGYVVCGGQVITDATSPLNGRTIPNINNDVFLKGHTTSNTTGGSNTHDHTVPGHYHYYGDHWSNDDSRWGHHPYGNNHGNTLQDGVVYGARTNSPHTHRGANDYNYNSMYKFIKNTWISITVINRNSIYDIIRAKSNSVDTKKKRTEILLD